jgi:hypothetical protein
MYGLPHIIITLDNQQRLTYLTQASLSGLSLRINCGIFGSRQNRSPKPKATGIGAPTGGNDDSHSRFILQRVPHSLKTDFQYFVIERTRAVLFAVSGRTLLPSDVYIY